MICSCCGKHKKPAGLEGMGTALKPAMELIAVARKPLSEKTVAANVLRWGTGAINVDGCRVGTEGATRKTNPAKNDSVNAYGNGLNGGGCESIPGLGRFPANLCHDGSDEVLAAFPVTTSGKLQTHHKLAASENNSMSGANYARSPRQDMGGDSGSAARFYYSAKASKADRALSKHPTVKPVKLMQWLVRLITPPGGVTLDPFAGTGTTGEAAWREGFSAVLIEREEEYQADIERRMLFARAKPKGDDMVARKPRKKDCDPGMLELPFDTLPAEVFPLAATAASHATAAE